MDQNKSRAAPNKQPQVRFVSGLSWPRIPPSSQLQVMAMQAVFALTEWWPAEKIQRHQLVQAQALINHAQATVPYYKEALSDFVSRDVGQLSMEKFRRLPILTRENIQNAGDQLFTTSLPATHAPAFDVRTSGSTGRPVEVKGTGITGLMFKALGLRSHIWHKRDTSLSNMSIKPSKDSIRTGKGWSPGSQGRFVTVAHQRPVPELFKILLEGDPHYLQCYPSALRELLRLSREQGVTPNNLREIRTISEVLEPELREQAREQWGVTIVDMYSSEELNMIAIQCPHDEKNLHVQMESLLVEVLNDDDQPCQVGEVGRCVVTSLTNFASPLIRYDIGDFAEVGECSCGRGLQALSKIVGRKYNLIILSNGDKFTPAMPPHDALFELPIRQFQLVQTKVEEIEIRVITDRELSGDEEERLAAMYRDRMQIPVPMSFVVRYVDEIPRRPNGKYDLFRTEVSE